MLPARLVLDVARVGRSTLESRHEAARRSVRERRPVVAAHPRSDVSIYIARIARKLIVPRPSGPSAPRLGAV